MKHTQPKPEIIQHKNSYKSQRLRLTSDSSNAARRTFYRLEDSTDKPTIRTVITQSAFENKQRDLESEQRDLEQSLRDLERDQTQTRNLTSL